MHKNEYYPFDDHDFSLSNALYDCKLVFESIKNDEDFQKADSGLVMGYANEIIYALERVQQLDTGIEGGLD